jgi:PAS domain S-box-containing protein
LRAPDGRPLRAAGAHIDISKAKEAADQLKASEARFRNLANSMPQLVWTANERGEADYFNDKVGEFKSFLRRENGTWDWLSAIHPADRAAIEECWLKAVQERKVFSSELRLQMQSGDYRWFLARALPVSLSEDHPLQWFGTTTDIDDQKRASQDLTLAKQAAEASSEAKSRFLANMSHEIRSPMNSVLGYTDLLCEPNLSEEDRVSYASRIKLSGEHLLSILNDILDLSQIEFGRMNLHPEIFELREYLSHVHRSLSVLAQKKGLKFDFVLASPIPKRLQTDPMRMRQILLNVIGNAIKFTDSGFVRVIFRCQKSSPQAQQEDLLIVEVEDTGIGIDPKDTTHLFLPFSQVDSSNTRAFGGTGLGLHLSRRLAESLGGKLDLLRSQPGRGSCFQLSIPIGETQEFFETTSLGSKAEERGHHLAAADDSHHHLKILVAEDLPENQALIKIYLKKLQGSVDVANDGEEVLRMVEAKDYDLILMDIMMPRMDGLEATRRLRAGGFEKPIIALTAHALKEEIAKTIDAGCDGHLVKPIKKEDLYELIRKQTQDKVFDLSF